MNDVIFYGEVSMSEAVTQLYNNLTFAEQQEVYDFILYLTQKEKKPVDDAESERKKNRLEALNEFAGSMQETWKNVDALEYQKNLRSERNIG